MDDFVFLNLHRALVVLLLLGFGSAVLARVSQGTSFEASSHRLFFLFMGLVGLATFGALLVGPGHGLLSGTTLSLMALVAVWDVGAVTGAAVS